MNKSIPRSGIASHGPATYLGAPAPGQLPTTPYRLALLLAYEADVDLRSAKKALEHGAKAVKGRVGLRLELAARVLGIQLGPVER